MRKISIKMIVTGFLLFLAVSSLCSAGELPETIDLNTASQTGVVAVSGEETGDHMGLALASGDVNGDGMADLVVGAPHESSPGIGRVFVIFGSTGLKTTATLDMAENPGGVLRIQGESSGAQLGHSVAVGDIDGDGYDDIIFGAPTASPQGRSGAGAAYILFGSPDLATAGTVDIGTTSRTRVKLLGKNGTTPVEDQYPDYYYRTAAGDSTGKISSPAGYTSGDEFGISVTAGDLNGDGFADVIIGAWNADPQGRTNAGKTYVVFGSSNIREQNTIDMRQSSSGILTIIGLGNGDGSGFYTTAGDLNGDNYADLAISSLYADPGGRSDAGEIDLVFGSPDLAARGEIDLSVDQPGMTRIQGETPYDYAGVKLSVGDLDGDGFGDLCICAHGGDTPGGQNAGKAYVVFGHSSLAEDGDIQLSVHGNRVLCIMGEESENYLGPSAFGDVNADGITDLITGANGADPLGRYDAGKGYVIFGSATLRSLGELDLRQTFPGVLRVMGADANGRLGYVCASGDMDDDGYSEIIFGSHGSNSAGAHIIFGNTFNGEIPVSQNHFTFTTNTGKNATVLIPKESQPTLSGTPIAVGDEIGVFSSSGTCAGAGVWNGKNLAITVWGDDPNSTVRDGFLEGETYSIRIWDTSTGRVYETAVQYSQGSGVYYTDSISILNALEAKVAEMNLSLSAGWNMVSSPVIADNSILTSLLSGIEGNMVLLKNGKGEIYWPEYDIHQVAEWDVTEGYQIYMNVPGEVLFSGLAAFPQDVVYSLRNGWNLISFIGAEGMSPSDAFDTLSGKLILVKDSDGNVFWPQYDVNQIQKLHHGQGYWICLNAASSFTYPLNPTPTNKTVATRKVGSRFNPVSRTGNNAVLLFCSGTGITLNGQPPGTGDEIGVYSPSGLCVGSGRWEEGKNLAVTVWGDNTMTDVRDGIIPGEEYSFSVWDADTGQEYEAAVTYTQGDTLYTPNGLAIIGTLRAGTSTAVEEIPCDFSLSQNSPNPFNPATTISFTIPRTVKVNIAVYNVLGAKVATLADGSFSGGTYRLIWKAEGMASGPYFCRMRTEDYTETRRMMFVK